VGQKMSVNFFGFGRDPYEKNKVITEGVDYTKHLKMKKNVRVLLRTKVSTSETSKQN